MLGPFHQVWFWAETNERTSSRSNVSRSVVTIDISWVVFRLEDVSDRGEWIYFRIN